MADITVLNATDPSTEEDHPLLPGNIVQSLEDWAHKRFKTVGTKGKAVTHLPHIRAHLIKPENVRVLLNSDKPAILAQRPW